jgi:hypothetical protein
MKELDNFIANLPNQSEIARLNKKLDDLRDKFDEIMYDYDTTGVISSTDRKRFYEILGVNE